MVFCHLAIIVRTVIEKFLLNVIGIKVKDDTQNKNR